MVREFSAEDVRVAVDVRGALEGLAARRLAERGLGEPLRRTLDGCLAAGDRVVSAAQLCEQGIAEWSRLNARFHGAIVGLDGASGVIADAIARNNHLPFASADSITVQNWFTSGAHKVEHVEYATPFIALPDVAIVGSVHHVALAHPAH